MLDNFYTAFADELDKIAAGFKSDKTFNQWRQDTEAAKGAPVKRMFPASVKGQKPGEGIPDRSKGFGPVQEPHPQGKGVKKRAEIFKKVPALPAPTKLIRIGR
jgi:hypothetical protein